MNSDSKTSCRKFLNILYILPVYSQYIFSIRCFLLRIDPYSTQIPIFTT